MHLQYSELCDRDLEAYQSYLIASCVVASHVGGGTVGELTPVVGGGSEFAGQVCIGDVGAFKVVDADVGEVRCGCAGGACVCRFGKNLVAAVRKDGTACATARSGSGCGSAAVAGAESGRGVERLGGGTSSGDECVESALGSDRACGSESRRVTVDGVSGCGQHARAERGDASVGVGQRVTVSGGVTAERGKHYVKNKVRREKRKRMMSDWRGCRQGVGDGVGSVSGTVRTVDTRTAVEVKAAETLAARRVAENRVAEALAAHKLRALKDKDRTAMVDRLAAARGEQRINEARAKSQASFKKCDESLKSLGSSGSAGEFALKQELKRAKDNEKTHEYVKQQLMLALKFMPAEGMRQLAELPAPVFEDEMEVFDGCPSDYDEDEQEAFFNDVNQRNADAFDREYSHV